MFLVTSSLISAASFKSLSLHSSICKTANVKYVSCFTSTHPSCLFNAGDLRDVGSMPDSGRSPGGGHINPLQYSFLENHMNRRAWWASLHGHKKWGTTEVTEHACKHPSPSSPHPLPTLDSSTFCSAQKWSLANRSHQSVMR